MRVDKHTGTVWVPVGGEDVPISFKWGEISQLRGTYGSDWESEINKIIGDIDAVRFAEVLAVCSGKSAAWWVEKSPPFVPLAYAVKEALSLAFFGPEGPKDNPTTGLLSMILSRLPGASGSSQGAGKPISSS